MYTLHKLLKLHQQYISWYIELYIRHDLPLVWFGWVECCKMNQWEIRTRLCPYLVTCPNMVKLITAPGSEHLPAGGLCSLHWPVSVQGSLQADHCRHTQCCHGHRPHIKEKTDKESNSRHITCRGDTS